MHIRVVVGHRCNRDEQWYVTAASIAIKCSLYGRSRVRACTRTNEYDVSYEHN